MQINELNSMLGITKENIRYYEKEGLISPARKANGYRDYSEEDVSRLKKILVLRKIGVSVADIRDVLEGSRQLDAVLNETIMKLDKEINTMQEARKVCLDLESSRVSISELDPDPYLEKMTGKSGAGFADLTKDVLAYSSDLFVESFGHLQFFFPIFKPLLWKRKRKGSVILAVAMCGLFIIGGGRICWWMNLRNNMTPGHYWLRGMAVSALIVIIWLMLRNIVYFLSKKYPKAEKPIVISGSILSALVSLALVFIAVFHWGRLLMFRPYEGPPVILDENADQLVILRHDEISSEENDFTPSDRSLYYSSIDKEYNLAVQKALLECVPTGQWSTTKNDFDLFDMRKTLNMPDEFWQIQWTGKGEVRGTVFYLIHDGKNGWTKDPANEWIVDEPSYGIFTAGEELVSLVREYEKHITINEGVPQSFERIFEYDPERIWKDEMYKDGRFDTYQYLTIEDNQTGEDITEAFISQYREAYENRDWDTLIEARKTIREIWRTEYVNPEAAHMDGAG